MSRGWAKDLEPGQVPCLALPIDTPEDCLAQGHWHTFSSFLQPFRSADKKNTLSPTHIFRDFYYTVIDGLKAQHTEKLALVYEVLLSCIFIAALLHLIENAYKLWIFSLFYCWGCCAGETVIPKIQDAGVKTQRQSWNFKACSANSIMKQAVSGFNKIIDFIRISVVDAVLFPDQRVHCCRQSGPLTGVEWKAPCSFLLLAWKRHKWAVEALLAERIKLHDYPGQTITWITADLHCSVLCSVALSLA